MECKKCGTTINKPGISFCPNCGAYLRESIIDNNTVLNNNTVVENKKPFVIKKDVTNKASNLILALLVLGLWIVAMYFIINTNNEKDYFFLGVNNKEVQSDNNQNNTENPDGENSSKETESSAPTSPSTPANPTTPSTPTTPTNPTTPVTPTTPTTPTTPVTPATPTTPASPISPSDRFASLQGVSKSGYNGVVTDQYQTSVIFDNQYFKQIDLTGKPEVLDLIRYDSNNQKKKCNNSVMAVENSIINNYGITAVNLCEMDVDFALELEKVVSYVYSNFPTARNYMTNMTLANVTNANYMASFMPIFTFITSKNVSNYPVGIKSQIILNTKYFLNPKKIANSASYGSSSGYFPPNAVRSSTVAHEFGHYLSYVAMLNYYKNTEMIYIEPTKSNLMFTIYDDFNDGDFSKKLLEEAYAEYKKNYGSSMTFDQFRGSISSYAVAKDERGDYIYDETIAEAFHDWYLNGNNANLQVL
jgi:cytoskeletal protein RodZ